MDKQNNFKNIIERRKDFPSLKRTVNDVQLAYLDGPGGTQVPKQVIDAMVSYYENSNSNTHGYFATTKETDKVIEEARNAMKDFLVAESINEISFGQNMTTLNFSLSNAIGRLLNPGDEILITQLDHEANRGPWLNLRENGIIVREIKIKNDCTLDYDDLKEKLNERTRLVAVGIASNAFGTVNDIPLIRELTYKSGAWLMVDAVHYAPHFPIDVKALGVDFLICSAYKFYGPHVGILYAKEGLLDQLQPDRLRTQDQRAPNRIETGTLNHAALAGVKAAVDYISSIGTGKNKREKLVTAMERIHQYEFHLAALLYDGLKETAGVTVYGLSFESTQRAPTISFTLEGYDPVEVCTYLGEKGICAWDGNFYAIRPVEVLGLLEQGGLTRAGISLYNTEEDIKRFILVVNELTKKGK